MSNTFYFKNDNELYHFGILGMKWGVRRYQNTDGSLTPAGKKRYGDEILKKDRKLHSLKAKAGAAYANGLVGYKQYYASRSRNHGMVESWLKTVLTQSIGRGVGSSIGAMAVSALGTDDLSINSAIISGSSMVGGLMASKIGYNYERSQYMKEKNI